MEIDAIEVADRFGLRHGQLWAEYKLKNQQWFLNGKKIGFGDLRTSDILRISNTLEEGEVFEGFNEHHGGQFQQRENPMVTIKLHNIDFPNPVRVSDETRAKLAHPSNVR